MISTWANVIRENAGADVFLWRNKRKSAGVLSGATTIWILFELVEYHFLTLVFQLLILALVVLFIWSTAAKFINMRSPDNPVKLDEELVLQFASALSNQLNRALDKLQEVASGKEVKKFLAIILGLWILSIIGSWCNFLTLLYISCILLHTLPVLYEKYNDKIDAYEEKVVTEIKKMYVVVDAKVLSKILRRPKTDEKTE